MKFSENQGRHTEIDSGTFKKVIRETKELGVNKILFIGGEPFLRKDLFDFGQRLKKNGRRKNMAGLVKKSRY